ncbi:MAG: type II secretion system protein GspM, partial [Burkholderiales bacterium]
MLSAKIDDMNLRERGLIFAMVSLILIALINTLFLDPLLAKQKTLSQQIVLQQNQIKAVQAQLEAIAAALRSDPNAANRARLELINKQLEQIEAFLHGKQQNLIPPDKMADLLEEILTRNRQLQLVSLQTLPVSTVTGKKVEEPAVDEKSFFKHGVEITVQGNYLDLLDYVAQLEKLPWQMFWGRARLGVEEYPSARLTLTLYTLSLEKAWLVI